MTHAYREVYLRRAMTKLGFMFDFAISCVGIPGEEFSGLFAASQTAKRLECGDPKYLLGMCGEELAMRVIKETTGIIVEEECEENFGRSPDYWCGWAIAYYQWLHGISYKRIFEILSYTEISAMYPTFHEADISRFADAVDAARRQRIKETNLRRIRTAYGCSQSELAAASGVSLRSIQMYEQRRKDINKGQSATLLSLARVLGCSMEALME